MGSAGIGREGREVQGAGMRGVYPFTVGKSCGDRREGGYNVKCGRIGGQEVAGGAGVEDGPTFDGLGVSIDGLEEGCSCESIVVGGVRTSRRIKNNIGAKFRTTVRP